MKTTPTARTTPTVAKKQPKQPRNDEQVKLDARS